MDTGKLGAWVVFTVLVVVVSPVRRQSVAAAADVPAAGPSASQQQARDGCRKAQHRVAQDGHRRTHLAVTWRETQWTWNQGTRQGGC